ncbi:MAG: hypothetical protein KBG82_02065 [Spirochaetes bacterium]|nr:hypothetical protein [Spirochaetota bacterium]MBP8990745.1 hypothetical protein [Spirochaetota bacterium]NLJ04077.1 hypothetical protein [Exilispira sp.]HNV43971.1 hypothetical protein [Exilispira sp.]HQQ18969.1 hypothetical protein [Exilispira sp.]
MKKYLVVLAIFCALMLLAAGCQTTSSSTTATTQEQTEEEKKAEEGEATKEEQPAFDDENASKLLDEAKLEIAKAEQAGAEEYSSELYREALDLFAQAEKLYQEKKDYATYQQVIEKARATAALAYKESAEKRYIEEKQKINEIISSISTALSFEYYGDSATKADLLIQEADKLKEEGNYTDALLKLEEAKKIYLQIQESYEADKNYVYQEFPKIMDLKEKFTDKNIKAIFSKDYEKFNEMYNDINAAIANKDYKKAKELLQVAYIFGANMLERYNQAVKLISQTEASRYLFEAKQAYEIVKEKEGSLDVDGKLKLKEMEDNILQAEQMLSAEQFNESVEFSKKALKIYLQLILSATNGENKTYVVRLIPQRRDCLWRIAGYPFIYNNPYLWPLIWIANLDIITNPDLIFPGQVLIIPPLPQ